MLRKWGYTFNQKTLEVIGNEVLAIVAMHNQKNRSNASLVNEGHIEGDEFRLAKMTNEFGEEVFGVLVKELAATHQEILANKDKQILLKNETDELLIKLKQVEDEQAERLAELKKAQEQLDVYLKEIQEEVRIETRLKEESELWNTFLSERDLKRFYGARQNTKWGPLFNQFCLDLGGLVEMKLPPSSDEHTILVEKRMDILMKWTRNIDGDGDTARAFLLKFNEQLSKIEHEYKQYNQTRNTRRSNIKKLIVGSLLDEGTNGYYSSQIDVYDDFLQQFGKDS